MRLLGNILWLLFGGLAIALEYLVSSLALMLTIVGIPFGIKTLKLALIALWPFGTDVVKTESSGGCLSICMNIIWFFIGGLPICITHLFLGALLCITIIGIPFGRQHFKMAGWAIAPFGKDVSLS